MLAGDLLAAVPAPVRAICGRLQAAGHEAFVVGGAVRDLLRGRPRGDWDVATSALPAQVLDLFDKAIPTGLKHGTVTVVEGGLSVEVTTFRVESVYSDGRHPDGVVFVRRLEDDLARRDFTVNAMALDVRDGGLRDPFGGRADLDAAVLRAVGDPRQRLAEDGLRALRAVRFAATLEMQLDPALRAAISETLPGLRRVSPERVRAEIEKLLAAPRPSRGLAPARETGLLAEILPELAGAGDAIVDRAFARADRTEPQWVLRFAALHAELGPGATAAALARLKPSARDLELAVALVEALPILDAATATGPSVRRALSAIGRERAAAAIALWRAHRQPTEAVAEVCRMAEEALRSKVPLSVGDLAIDGGEVQAVLGLSPGPEVGRALRNLLEVVLEDPQQNDPQALRERLRALRP